MGFSNRRAFRQSLPAELADRSYEEFDHGTQRAVLNLYRSAPPEVLEQAGARLGELRGPALIEWPTRDPYIGPEFGQKLADALGGPTELNMVDAGHYPWLERPELIERVASFVG
jgi:pimeloyl-ACP methyl ester carboxylesterase